MCGRNEECFPRATTCWKIAMAYAHYTGYEHTLLILKNKHRKNKKGHWWWAIVAWTQEIKKKLNKKWKQTYISMARGMKSAPDVRFVYDSVFCWTTIVVACVVVHDAQCTISEQIKLTMTMSTKVWKLFLEIRAPTCHRMWHNKRWDIF
jgi:hypothetical protein